MSTAFYRKLNSAQHNTITPLNASKHPGNIGWKKS